jgi:hypothetical protein
MRIITGNLLDITQGTIAHQTNCRGLAGPVLARSIGIKYPEWEAVYKAVCRRYTVDKLIGQLHLYRATPTLTIASLFAQRLPGRGLMTDYDALDYALIQLNMKSSPTNPIYLPYGVGCGNAGGDWGTVQQLIEVNCPDAILVKLPSST